MNLGLKSLSKEPESVHEATYVDLNLQSKLWINMKTFSGRASYIFLNQENNDMEH